MPRKLLWPEKNSPSRSVLKYDLPRVINDAKEMALLIDTEDFEGYYKKALALAHCQVFANPLQFFVVNKPTAKLLGSRIIVNPKITGVMPPKVKLDEACMSHPFRKPAVLERYQGVMVEYEIPFLGRFLRKKKIALEGQLAQMFQHEYGHFFGQSPYQHDTIKTFSNEPQAT